jgi:nucleoside-specific outer membrane channel protein Tsx
METVIKQVAIVCSFLVASGASRVALSQTEAPVEPSTAPKSEAPVEPSTAPKSDPPVEPSTAPKSEPPPESSAAPKSEVPLVPAKSEARKLIQWSAFDFQYLYGANWKLGAKKKDILTLEHADGWLYGDNYLFVDVSHIANQSDPTSVYGEWQPRVSVSKLLGQKWGFGDVLETNRLAFSGGFLAHLSGIAVDLNIPGFAYFHQHAFVRNDIHLDGITWQLTTEWSVPISLGPIRLVQDGFVHFIGKEGTAQFNIITQPQLLLDLGNFGGYEDQLFVGTEVDIRYNEYGIKGQNEVVPQAMAEWKL